MAYDALWEVANNMADELSIACEELDSAKAKMQLMANFIRSFVEIADEQKAFVTVYDSDYAKVKLRSVTIQIAQEGIENLRKLIEVQK